mmetsp:Transcript_88586/g.228436  ORF Transcript_88586/g.228436 Transcript_88586/m.228436 type:complete len:237 (-) Transcript_88586:275-985(-)
MAGEVHEVLAPEPGTADVALEAEEALGAVVLHLLREHVAPVDAPGDLLGRHCAQAADHGLHLLIGARVEELGVGPKLRREVPLDELLGLVLLLGRGRHAVGPPVHDADNNGQALGLQRCQHGVAELVKRWLLETSIRPHDRQHDVRAHDDVHDRDQVAQGVDEENTRLATAGAALRVVGQHCSRRHLRGELGGGLHVHAASRQDLPLQRQGVGFRMEGDDSDYLGWGIRGEVVVCA